MSKSSLLRNTDGCFDVACIVANSIILVNFDLVPLLLLLFNLLRLESFLLRRIMTLIFFLTYALVDVPSKISNAQMH